MRNFSRTGFFVLIGLLSVGTGRAHVVDWMENPWGYAPANAMVFYYPREFSDRFYVDPSYFEPCTVVVNLNSSSSTLVNAQVLPPNPANSVAILVQILRAPSNHLETATISGEWHATGLPMGFGCDAVSPNPFSVPISVTDQLPVFRIVSIANGWVNLSGPNAALQSADCLSGPWGTLGIGPSFSVKQMMHSSFFLQTKQMGNFVAGYMIDNSGSPMPNLTLGLQYGGPTAYSDSSGTFSLPRLPAGLNWISISNPVGATLNVGITNTDNTPTNPYTPATIKAVMAAAPPVSSTNICNCTPWCAIGFATLPGGQTPVYYAGGANSPNSGTPECGAPVVTVTPPGGVSFTITPGGTHHHNSGPNPASGTWTVTAVVCGQTKSATVTVP